ncbi:MAG: peptidylprolyl isomerase [Clostridia bacterium]|nr:peptidylprolyl isomerase [Clostridia bacterium]
MAFKKIGRVICAVALSGMALAAPMLAACNTDHPEAKITVEFDGVSYVLEYKMYRNMYPQTVQHFIELADNGFYNDTIIHNYQSSSYMYGGGYGYSETDELSYMEAYAEGKEGLLDYLDSVSKEKEYATLADPAAGKITPSVYRDYQNGEYVNPLNTLIGEFSNNQHKIDNGALKGSYGALRMYYSAKSDAKNYVRLDKYGSADGVMGEYRYNSATSLFSIQMSSSTSSDSNYCIFATLKSNDTLNSLRDALSKTVSTTETSLYVDNYDEFLAANSNEATYRVPNKAIIVRSVEITKY